MTKRKGTNNTKNTNNQQKTKDWAT